MSNHGACYSKKNTANTLCTCSCQYDINVTLLHLLIFDKLMDANISSVGVHQYSFHGVSWWHIWGQGH